MNKTIVCFLLICSAAFAASRNEDLKVIIEKTYLTSQCEPLLNMMAMEAITTTEKKIDSEKLVELFKKKFEDPKNLAKFFEPYDNLFSDEEIKELRKIQENPVWQKYSQEGMPIFQANLETLKETFKELAVNFVVEETNEVVDSNLIEITQENVGDIQGSNLPVILDVNATWCNPCRMMEPIIEELSSKYEGKVQFAKMDYDSQGALAKQYGVTSLPTILFFKPGQKTPAMKNVGFMSKKDFEAKIAEFLKK